MCLGVPGRIVSLTGDPHDGEHEQVGLVDFGGVSREVSMAIVDEPVAVGDHVLVHVGFAIRRIPEDEIASTYQFFADLAASSPDDLEGLPAPRPSPIPPKPDAPPS